MITYYHINVYNYTVYSLQVSNHALYSLVIYIHGSIHPPNKLIIKSSRMEMPFKFVSAKLEGKYWKTETRAKYTTQHVEED